MRGAQDKAIMSGQRVLKTASIAGWKLLIPSALVLSFFAGALFGTALTTQLNLPALLIWSLCYITGGIGWTLFKHVFLALKRKQPVD